MKHHNTALRLALCAALTALTATLSAQTRVPRPEGLFATGRPMSLRPQVAEPAMPGPALPAARTLPRRQRTVRDGVASVLTAYEKTGAGSRDWQNSSESGIMTYDDLGYVLTCNKKGTSYGQPFDYTDTYSYEGNVGGNWVKRVGYEHTNDGDGTETIEREFDSGGRLVRSTRSYISSDGKDKYKDIRFYGYEREPGGELTGKEEWDWDSETGEYYLYNKDDAVWFPLINKYLLFKAYEENGNSDDDLYCSRTRLAFGADSLSYTLVTERNSGYGKDDWHVTGEKGEYYYPEGRRMTSYEINYNDDGTVAWAYGLRIVRTADAPQAGWETLVYEKVGTGADQKPVWTPTEKFEQTVGYSAPHIPGDAPRQRTCYWYSATDGQWQRSRTEACQWAGADILMWTTTRGGDGEDLDGDGVPDESWTATDYYKYTATGEDLGYVEYFGDGYVVMYFTNTGGERPGYYYYDYYTASGTLLKRLRVVRTRVSWTRYDARQTVEEWKDDQWQAAAGTIELPDNGQTVRLTLGADGYPATEERLDGGEIISKYVYTYSATGFTRDGYRRDDDGGTLTQYDHYVLGMIDDNIMRETYIDMTNPSRSNQIDKNLLTGVIIQYNWDEASGSFIFGYCFPNPVYTEDADGWRTMVMYYVTDKKTGEAAPGSKTLTQISTGTQVEYLWYGTEWVPTHYHANYAIPVDFAYIRPADPAYEIGATLESELGMSLAQSDADRFCNRRYAIANWNIADERWDYQVNTSETVSVEGNTLTSVERNELSGSTTETRVSVDSERRLLSERELYTDNGRVNKRETIFTYDGEGNLTSETYNNDSFDGNYEKRVYVYHWGHITISGIGLPEADGGQAPRVEGGRIVSPDGARLSVIDMAGRRVAEGAGSVAVPAKGVYIVSSRGRSYKMAVR